MTKSTEEAISALNTLTEICKDGENGYRSAAEDVQDPTLKGIFQQYSMERGRFVSELQQQVQSLGGKPEESGTAGGALHRGWLNVKAAVTGKDAHAVLSECERGEDAAKDAYEKTINGSAIPGTILPMVQNQYQKVMEAHDRVKELRDREKNAQPAGRRAPR